MTISSSTLSFTDGMIEAISTVDEKINKKIDTLKRICTTSIRHTYNDLEGKIYKQNDEFLNIVKEEHDRYTKELNNTYKALINEIDELRDDIASNYYKKVKCSISRHKFMEWYLYIDGHCDGIYPTRFIARCRAKSVVKRMRQKKTIECDLNGNICEEEFIL